MNYTYYKKLKNIYLKSNEELTKEIFAVSEKGVSNLWGFTDSMNEYIKCLKQIKIINRLKLKILRKIILKKQAKKLKNKIRVAFFVNEYSTFPSVMSVYEEMIKDDNFICDLVHVPFNHFNKSVLVEKEINDYKERGFDKIIESEKYDLAKASPDIVIYLKPYDLIPKRFYVDEIKKVVDYIIYIPYGMHIFSNDPEMLKFSFKLPIEENAWKILTHSKRNIELAKKYSIHKDKNLLNIGNPKMDLMDRDFSDNELYKLIKEKAKGRKIFMYNPYHVIDDKNKSGTFKLFGIDILKYFKENNDIFLLYRPHPLLKKVLEKELNSNFFKEYNELLKSENIFYDDSSDYLISMHISDYLISDCGSFIPEFTMYNKPVIYLIYNDNNLIVDKDLNSMIYSANTMKKIIDIINKLKINEDELKEIRTNLRKKYFWYDENKTVAQKLIDIIKKEFID